MFIENNILKHYLQNVYFITGTAYAGKFTMVKMLAEKYCLVCCSENYHCKVTDKVAEPNIQPNLCYMQQMNSWENFVKRSPEEYEKWMYGVADEVAGFEIVELLSISKDKKVIVDTNIPISILKEISDYRHVAVMLSPQSMSVDHFFDRTDDEKQFILSVIENCDNPDEVMANYKAGLELINGEKHYNEYAQSGFFTLVREDTERDTREEVCDKLAKHFGFIKNDFNVDELEIKKVDQNTDLADRLICFVENFTWKEVKSHMLEILKKWVFTDWETPFVAIVNGKIAGMACIMKTDYYPLPKIYPWVSSVFVSEDYRGYRISEKLIDFANEYAKECGFSRTYIPSERIGLYEKYGYRYLKNITNYGNETDHLYVKELK